MGQIKYRITTPFDGYKGWEHNGKIYRLAVSCNIAEGPNGELLAGTMTGGDTEPCDDHISIIMRSYDHGQTWSEPEELIGNENGVNGSGGTYNIDGRTLFDGKNYLSVDLWPAEEKYMVWNHYTAVSTDGVRTWSEPKPVTFDGVNDSYYGVGNITRTSKGELLAAGIVNVRRDRPLTAGVERLALAKTEEEAVAMEPLKEGETPLDSRIDTYITKAVCFEVSEDLTSFKPRGIVGNRPLGLTEPHLIEMKDGSLALFCRAEWAGFLWRADSFDGGHTWTDAYQTDIPNPSSLARFLRLPDGRIALFHNPTGGVVGKRGDRKRLAVWVSNDEAKTWYIKEDIVAGEFYLSYPEPRILSDGTICFGYDRNRRCAEYVEIEIPLME